MVNLSFLTFVRGFAWTAQFYTTSFTISAFSAFDIGNAETRNDYAHVVSTVLGAHRRGGSLKQIKQKKKNR